MLASAPATTPPTIAYDQNLLGVCVLSSTWVPGDESPEDSDAVAAASLDPRGRNLRGPLARAQRPRGASAGRPAATGSENTYAGGADKAAHFVQYYIISREMSSLYRTLGYSASQSIAIGAGLGYLAGIINETGDSINRYGFSYEDFVMDVSGATLAALVAGFGVDDVVGFRTGIMLPTYSVPSAPGMVGEGYSSQIYTADLKLAGAARRLNLNIGPLRYLLFSMTYASRGYATGIADLRERQVGFEIGLNFEEILNSLGARRDTWWGYSLHFVLDNFRVPFTSVGFQYDLNGGKWYGPGNGNNFATR